MAEIPFTIEQARDALDNKDITASELVEESLSQIKHWEPKVHAFLETFAEKAQAEAKHFDEGSVTGELAGIPIAVKDNICTDFGHTTAASKMLENYEAPYNATVINKLKEAGAIIVGKTNLDEFAMGSSTEFSAYGPSKNPWDTSRVPGGSSGGSAVAVATGEVFGALGTDTGGSIRLPASFCNLVGVKPTYGRVSRFGVIAYGSSFDQVGPFARTVKDAALLLQVLAGEDKYDATSSKTRVPQYASALEGGVKSIRIGIPKEFFSESVDPEVAAIIREAISSLKELGAEIKEISLPLTEAGVPVYFLLAKSEGSSNLSRFDALRYGKVNISAETLIDRYKEARGKYLGPEVKRTILMGTYALSAGYYDAWYKQASKVRTLIKREYEQAFQGVDIIVGPVAPDPAFEFGSKGDDPLKMYLTDALTVTMSVAGVPAVSVPCGFTKSGLPVGMQLIAPHFAEERIFQVGHTYEQSHEWWKKTPNL